MSDGMLIVCGQKDFANNLLTIVSSSIPGSHSAALSGSDARRRISIHEYMAVLVAGRLPDEPSLDLVAEMSQSVDGNFIYITDRNELLDAHEALDGTGVTILSTPLTKSSLIQSIRLVLRVADGGGTFERAKLSLVQQKGWSESQAHRYIQKLSMDKRIPRELAAQMILKALKREVSDAPNE